jgi:TolB-like protein/DNA-binding winged helix-turn-helix (wHTH) protein/Flp pilus assembly protein TadD
MEWRWTSVDFVVAAGYCDVIITGLSSPGDVVEGDFRVGIWLIEPSLNAVSHNGASIHLAPKVMGVLVCLAQHAGQSVSKEDLLQAVWPDTFVGDDVLKGSISELRRVLEDDAREPTIIQTIPKRGYRLVAPVQPIHGAPESAERRPETQRAIVNTRKFWMGALAVAGAAFLFVFLGANIGGLRSRLARKSGVPQIHSLAVLPLQNLSADPAQEYFSEGMTDALITDLAQISSLKVISRTSIMHYKQTDKSLPEIARELNVDGIIEGTVQRSGDRVRITAQLIYGPSDKHLWANSYERDAPDVFALERDVTEEIARQVRARLRTPTDAPLAQPLPVSPQALDAYLQGNYYLTRGERSVSDEEKDRAAEYFQRVIDAEPGFVPAYIGLAKAHDNRLLGSSEDTAIRRKAAEKAVALDPRSSDGLNILANIRWAEFDWSGAEQEYRQAVALNPNSASAHEGFGDFVSAMGRLDEGLREVLLAQELDPNEDHVSNILCMRGEYDRAIELLQRIAASHPDDGVVHYNLYRAYAQKGAHKEAVEELVKAAELFGMSDLASNVRRTFAVSGWLGAMRQFAKDLVRLQAAGRMFAPENLAVAYFALGDKDRAFYWLGQGYEHREMASHDWGVMILKVDPLLAPLRSDPRFTDLLRRMGVPPYAGRS